MSSGEELETKVANRLREIGVEAVQLSAKNGLIEIHGQRIMPDIVVMDEDGKRPVAIVEVKSGNRGEDWAYGEVKKEYGWLIDEMACFCATMDKNGCLVIARILKGRLSVPRWIRLDNKDDTLELFERATSKVTRKDEELRKNLKLLSAVVFLLSAAFIAAEPFHEYSAKVYCSIGVGVLFLAWAMKIPIRFESNMAKIVYEEKAAKEETE